MPREFKRTDRVADQIQRELALLLQRETRDPRLTMLTVSGVEVTRDLAHARIYVSSLDAQAPEDDVVEGLRHARGFLRTQLAHKLRIRVVPELHFEYDTSALEGERLDRLIAQAVAEDNRDTKPPEEET